MRMMASATPERLSPAMMPEAQMMRKREDQLGTTFSKRVASMAPIKMEMPLKAGMTNPNPTLVGLGTHVRYFLGSTFSKTANTIPVIPPIHMPATAPWGNAFKPVINSSATAFQAATLGAGHCSVSNSVAGFLMRIS